MNIAYFGSPLLSKLLLDQLLEHEIPIRLIITQPDKIAGKRLEMTETPVKTTAIAHDIDYFDKRLKDHEDELISIIRENEITLGILFAYGEILSPRLLNSMQYGIWNVHPSLLPKYRGPSPIVFPLILGETETGTTLMQMNEALDEGDILKQTAISIGIPDNRERIERKLVDTAVKQVINALSLLKTDTLQSKQQDSRFATYTKLLKKADGFITQKFISQALNNENITFEELPAVIQNYYQKNNIIPPEIHHAGLIFYHLYQGLHPWPGIWTLIKINTVEKRLKILDVQLNNNRPQIISVQLEGKKPVDFSTFRKAYSQHINL